MLAATPRAQIAFRACTGVASTCWRSGNERSCKSQHPVARRLLAMMMSTGGFAMKMLACATVLALALAPSCGFAQAPKGQSMSDDELIKLALSAAPDAVSKDATVIAMSADGKMRTLRKGTEI